MAISKDTSLLPASTTAGALTKACGHSLDPSAGAPVRQYSAAQIARMVRLYDAKNLCPTLNLVDGKPAWISFNLLDTKPFRGRGDQMRKVVSSPLYIESRQILFDHLDRIGRIKRWRGRAE